MSVRRIHQIVREDYETFKHRGRYLEMSRDARGILLAATPVQEPPQPWNPQWASYGGALFGMTIVVNPDLAAGEWRLIGVGRQVVEWGVIGQHWGPWRFARESRRFIGPRGVRRWWRFLAGLPGAWRTFRRAQAADEAGRADESVR